MSNEKMNEKTNEVISEMDDEVSEENESSNSLVFDDNSFAYCINNITSIPEDIFGDITSHIKNLGTDDWYKPYNDILKHHGYDMIFYGYKDSLPLNDEILVEQYQFNNLPTGKCIILGTDEESRLRCMVGLMDEDHRVKIIYDPIPTSNFTEICNIGFFIKTFVSPPSITVLDTGEEIELENDV
jgi:hypothetical protein